MYVYIPRTDTVQDDVHTPASHTLISEIQARVELLEQELERAHERDRETRRLLAAALERIPPQLEAPPDEREFPETVEVAPEKVESRSAPQVLKGTRSGGLGDVGCAGDE